MININRAYKAMHRIDPNGDIRWYITTDGCEIKIQGQLYYKETAIQSSVEFYENYNDYDKFFKKVYDTMIKLKETLGE